jgi:hypothetical protein
MVFELPATGGVKPTYLVQPVKLLRYVSTTDFFIMFCEFFWMLFILYYIIEEAIEVNHIKYLTS